MSVYAYECNRCEWVGPGNDSENDAWGDGVEHMNHTGHEGGTVTTLDP